MGAGDRAAGQDVCRALHDVYRTRRRRGAVAPVDRGGKRLLSVAGQARETGIGERAHDERFGLARTSGLVRRSCQRW